ncbi:spheroidene monooxygenase [Litorisediminicola beolgyonensis]|uniref:Spheroidene monooxygenase n=1 Tax=Litorisediminicola beolgyonensis TaxID=1173614 RepID=A0ABW3ZDN7_9RHOB
MQITSLSLFRFASRSARLWAFAMMGAARFPLARTEGLRFWKLCGSGTDEGFAPIPNTSVYAILGVWDDATTARDTIDSHPLWNRYRARASENWTLFLNPVSTRGAWSGKTPFAVSEDPGTGPIAALTRATIKPGIAARFWGRVPDISRVIGANPDVMFKIGIGELPLLHQVTFSVWPDAPSMARFARAGGPHAEAIRAVRDGRWFREELYARFRIAGETGAWEGRSPRLLTELQPEGSA